MRVGLDVSCLASNGRGFGRYVQTLLQGLSPVWEASDELLLFSDRDLPGGLVPDRFLPGLRILPSLPLRSLWRRDVLVPEAAKAGVEVLHFPENASAPASPMRAVVTFHGIVPLLPEGKGRFGWTTPWLFRMALGEARRNASLVIAVSDRVRSDLERWWGPAAPPLCTLWNGIPAATPARREAVPPYFLYVGALDAVKNLETLCEGFLRFRAATGLPHRLVLVGPRVRGIAVLPARLPRDPAIEVREAVPLASAGLDALYAGATALTAVPWYETFGYPWAEALARGCPVLGSSSGAGPEILGDAALLADPADPAAVASALERLARDGELRAELARRGLDRARRYSLEVMAVGVLGAYRSVLAR